MTKEEFIKYCSEINIKITDILYDKLLLLMRMFSYYIFMTHYVLIRQVI